MPWAIAGCVLVALPFVYREPYPLHIMVLILIWSFVYTSWSVMGRFGLVSLGHGGFFGIGAYVTALLWNYLSPDALAGHSARHACRRRGRAGHRLSLLRAFASPDIISRW